MERPSTFYEHVKRALTQSLAGKNLKERRRIEETIREVDEYIEAQKNLDSTVSDLLKKGKFIDIRV